MLSITTKGFVVIDVEIDVVIDVVTHGRSTQWAPSTMGSERPLAGGGCHRDEGKEPSFTQKKCPHNLTGCRTGCPSLMGTSARYMSMSPSRRRQHTVPRRASKGTAVYRAIPHIDVLFLVSAAPVRNSYSK